MKKVMQIIALFLFVLVSLSCVNVSAQEEAYLRLEAIESLASQQLNEGHPELALEQYRQYEKMMTDAGLENLNPELLMNQAVAAYQAGLYGESIAYLKQLNVISRRDDVSVMTDELQTLIEHRIYQKSPNLAFVRGVSSDYTFWAYIHQISEFDSRMYLLICWGLFCLVVMGVVIFRCHKLMKIMLFVFSLFLFLMNLGLGIFCIYHQKSGQERYGVLLDNMTVHLDPGSDAEVHPDRAFVPGMTVRVQSKLSGWLKIERVDGVSGWVESSQCYILRGIGELESRHSE